MTAVSVEHLYQYRHVSRLDTDSGTLQLATCGRSAHEHPYFFEGDLVNPQLTARLLLGLMSVVHARYHMPAAMVRRFVAFADPVVTCGDDMLRFEGFSACSGVYARLDLHAQAIHGQRLGRGTTNVDFNQPMLTALAMVRPNDAVRLSVGGDAVELTTNDNSVIEKKVELPYRWLKGFVEVQACQQRMQQVFELSGPEAARFFRTLPRMKTNRRQTWITSAGRGLRLTQVKPSGGAVRVGGLERLAVLQPLASQATRLGVYADEVTGASGWELAFGDRRFHLVISPEVWRGFSGEGQALRSLVNSQWGEVLDQIQMNLDWHAVISEKDIVKGAKVPADVVTDALAALGTRGVVGYDLGEHAYFHRELPFDLSKVGMTQPRLRSARKLVNEGSVKIMASADGDVEAIVTSGGLEYRVHLVGDDAKCTCPWYAKHHNERGPCKHILAAQITLTEQDNE